MGAGAAVALFCTCLDQEAVLCVALLPLTLLSHRLLIIVFRWTWILAWSSSTSSSDHLVRSCSSFILSKIILVFNSIKRLLVSYQVNIIHPHLTFTIHFLHFFSQNNPSSDYRCLTTRKKDWSRWWSLTGKGGKLNWSLTKLPLPRIPLLFWCGNGDSQTFRDFLSPGLDDTHLVPSPTFSPAPFFLLLAFALFAISIQLAVIKK